MRNYFDFFKHPIKTINVKFDGYVLDQDKDCLPDYKGVYLVYHCLCSQGTCKLKELIYIGKADDQTIRKRLSNHEKHDEFVKRCGGQQNICYAYAEVDKKDIDTVENALICKQQPVLNDKLKDNYNHETCHFVISGKCVLLKETDFVCDAEDIKQIKRINEIIEKTK